MREPAPLSARQSPPSSVRISRDLFGLDHVEDPKRDDECAIASSLTATARPRSARAARRRGSRAASASAIVVNTLPRLVRRRVVAAARRGSGPRRAGPLCGQRSRPPRRASRYGGMSAKLSPMLNHERERRRGRRSTLVRRMIEIPAMTTAETCRRRRPRASAARLPCTRRRSRARPAAITSLANSASVSSGDSRGTTMRYVSILLG